MIKINYKNPEENETPEDIARANIIMSDKFKKGDYLEMSCISWLKLDSKRDYQDLEQLLRYLNLDSHIIAQPVKVIPENLEINYPNSNTSSEPLEYVVKISCRSKEEALKELLLSHPNYEENFECLKKTGCFMVKKVDPILEVEENLSIGEEITRYNEMTKIGHIVCQSTFSVLKQAQNGMLAQRIFKALRVSENLNAGGNKDKMSFLKFW